MVYTQASSVSRERIFGVFLNSSHHTILENSFVICTKDGIKAIDGFDRDVAERFIGVADRDIGIGQYGLVQIYGHRDLPAKHLPIPLGVIKQIVKEGISPGKPIYINTSDKYMFIRAM